jgi:hypothetical protein
MSDLSLRRVLILGALGLSLSSGRARAEEDPSSAAFAEGKARFRRGDFAGALTELEHAYRLRPHHTIRCSVATCLENLGRLVEAAEGYRRCLREGAEGTAMSTEVRASLQRVESRVTWVSVTEDPGASIRVDGAALGPTPGRFPLNPGCHVVELQRQGATTRVLTVQTAGGEQLTLGARPGPAPQLAAASPVWPDPPPPRRSRRRLMPAWFWSAVGITAGLVGASIALSAQTVQQRSEYESRPTQEAYQSFTNLRLATNIFWSFAAAAAGTSTVLFFYTDFGGKEGRDERRAMIGGRMRF